MAQTFRSKIAMAEGHGDHPAILRPLLLPGTLS
jgi:hypothetical protein